MKYNCESCLISLMFPKGEDRTNIILIFLSTFAIIILPLPFQDTKVSIVGKVQVPYISIFNYVIIIFNYIIIIFNYVKSFQFFI